MTIETLSSLFLLLVFVMACIVVGLFSRYLEGWSRTIAISIFAAWILYAGILGRAGIVAMRKPPGPALLLIPVALFIFLFLIRHPGVRTFAQKAPIPLLIGLQTFRIFVELGFHQLYELHLVPRMLTYNGANIDIAVGLTAPLVAWLYATGKIGTTGVRIWSFAGIAILLNIAVRAILTVPGPLNLLHTEVPNLAFGVFPFSYIPGFLAPLALCLHILLLRSTPRNEDMMQVNRLKG